MRFSNKKNFLIISLILVILTLFFVESVNSEWCKNSAVCSYLYWSDFWSEAIPTFLIALTITTLPVSLITLPFSQTVFDAWKRFAVFVIPLVLILTYFIAQMSSGGGVGVVGFHPGTVLLPLLYGAYFLISFTIIGVVWWKERKIRT